MAKYTLALVAILVLIGVMVYRMMTISQLAPPQYVQHFEQFIDWNDQVQRYRVGQSATGPVLLAEATDGPTYVFGANGQLIAWSASSSDSFQIKWGATDSAVDLNGAKAWFQKQSGNSGATPPDEPAIYNPPAPTPNKTDLPFAPAATA
jgi:hypothetical protein